jgi:hypothetical protein
MAVAVRGKNGKMVILPGITNSWTRNLPEEWLIGYSAGNCQLIDKESTGNY